MGRIYFIPIRRERPYEYKHGTAAVSLADGTRFGYVGDLEVDTDLGQITALIIPGRPRLLGLLGREPDRTIPWSAVRRFGEDIVLADLPGQQGD